MARAVRAYGHSEKHLILTRSVVRARTKPDENDKTNAADETVLDSSCPSCTPGAWMNPRNHTPNRPSAEYDKPYGHNACT